MKKKKRDEFNDKLRKQLQEDLGLSDEDVESVIKAHKHEEKKKFRKEVFLRILGITATLIMASVGFFIAITDKSMIHWFLAFTILGLATMDILNLRKKLNPEKANEDHVKYCAQITDVNDPVNSQVRKQDLFPTIEDAQDWIEKTVDKSEGGRIIDTANGKIIKIFHKGGIMKKCQKQK